MHLHKIPFFDRLEDSKNILLAGACGGFDIYSGIPLYFSLKAMGKQVVLGNFSFTWLKETTSEMVYPHCYRIRPSDQDRSGRFYFPEKLLGLWMSRRSEYPFIYGFERTGVQSLKKVYNYLIEKHNIDTIILVDGGTDSLMFGDEEGLGTPQEDICSMAAVYQTKVKKKLLCSIGFGVDHFHGVSHFRFLENVAQIMHDGGYLGLFQLTKEMNESQLYLEAVAFANELMRGRESIVSNSICSAIEGKYGNFHRTARTNGSELWINPLMTIYWCFELSAIIRANQYYSLIKDTNTIGDINGRLSRYRLGVKNLRTNRQIPI